MVKTKKLVIVGAGSNARIARYYFEKDTEYSVVSYAVEKAFIGEATFDGLSVFPIEEIENRFPSQNYHVFVAIGYTHMNTVRERLYKMLKALDYTLPNYISPRCNFLSEEPPGDNNFILEDNTIQPFVKIGSNNVLWSGNHIGHDVVIGSHNFITSQVVVSGFTQIENNCFLGVNSTLRDNIHVRNKTLIAAASIIMSDTEEEGVYVPARSVKLGKKSTEIKIS